MALSPLPSKKSREDTFEVCTSKEVGKQRLDSQKQKFATGLRNKRVDLLLLSLGRTKLHCDLEKKFLSCATYVHKKQN